MNTPAGERKRQKERGKVTISLRLLLIFLLVQRLHEPSNYLIWPMCVVFVCLALRLLYPLHSLPFGSILGNFKPIRIGTLISRIGSRRMANWYVGGKGESGNYVPNLYEQLPHRIWKLVLIPINNMLTHPLPDHTHSGQLTLLLQFSYM